jgi:hypothetical protein
MASKHESMMARRMAFMAAGKHDSLQACWQAGQSDGWLAGQLDGSSFPMRSIGKTPASNLACVSMPFFAFGHAVSWAG